MNGYSDKQLALDEQMAALGRPVPPVVSWLRSRPVGASGKPAWDAARAVWRTELIEWERASPEAAVTWHEMRQQYVAEDERVEAARWAHSADEYNYERIARMGAPRQCVDSIRFPKDTKPLKSAREWLLDDAWALTLLGGPGVGKTCAAAWAAHQLLMRNFKPKWVRCIAMAAAPLFGIEAELFRHQCRTVDVLVLDDVGAGAFEKDSKVWLNWLDDVLDARWGNKRRTLVTSNGTSAQLSTWLGPRLAGRLNTGTIMDCGAGSLRGVTP